MEVTISAAARFWAHRAASAAQAENALKYWVTGAPDHKGRGIDPSRVRFLPLPTYIRYGLEQTLPGLWGQYTALTVGDNLFDVFASRYAAECDVFHAYNHHGLISMRRAARHGVPTVVERASAHIDVQHRLLREEFARHGQRFPRLKWPLEWKHAQEYEEADHVIVTSEFVKRTMLQEGIPAEKLSVIPLGVNLEAFRPRPKPDDTFRVMFAGVISLRKGLPYLLEAFNRLGVPDAELLLVGAVYPEMRAIMRRYEGTYRLVGGVPQGELARLYNTASVFVMPSIEDGFGMVVAEAMASGTPVIVTENVGITVEDGQHGYVVPIRDAGAIHERLITLYEDEDLRRTLGENARAHAQQFSWEHYQRRVVAVYRRLSAG